jgi:hypothetical protein
VVLVYGLGGRGKSRLLSRFREMADGKLPDSPVSPGRRTVRSLMFAFRAIVAADGQHPVPSSREHASASASRTRRSLPDVG